MGVRSVGLPEDETWSPSRRAGYEQECLAATQEVLGKREHSEVPHHRLRAIRLEGSYPDTCIAVIYEHRSLGGERTGHYTLWAASDVGANGKRQDPEGLAVLIYAWVDET
jgi:hypothetical protein